MPLNLHALRIAALAVLGVWVLIAGACSTEMADSARRGMATPGFAAESSLTGDATAQAPRRVIQIEPDPERDAQIDTLVKAALDDLRSGEIQGALDVLMQAQSIEGWMNSEHAPAVLFWTGHAYDQLGEPFAARAAFRRITIQYPRSAFADRASRRLRELRSRTPQEN